MLELSLLFWYRQPIVLNATKLDTGPHLQEEGTHKPWHIDEGAQRIAVCLELLHDSRQSEEIIELPRVYEDTCGQE